MRRSTITSAFKQIRLLLLPLLLTGCALEKETGFNRTMQNITAHYNIVFNANELLRQKQDIYAASYIDNYNEILNVYQDLAPPVKTDKELDAVIMKANNVIAIKEQSHYIGDAYLILGKANHLYGNYFNAVEFFNYTIRSFKTRADLLQEARAWEVRSLLYLNNRKEAKLVLDSAFINLNPKKSITADIYADAMQYDIDTKNFIDAEAEAKKAIAATHLKTQRLRWIFILAQIQEQNHELQDAVFNYTRIVQSNASFEMAFNADLNRVRIDDARQGNKLSRMDRLRKMLKNDNNKEFIDQIYYQIAQLYLAQNNIDKAIENLKLSIRRSLRNQNQKGLSYLLLADINFKYKSDFVTAKKFYDSTLLNLSTTYPDYALIQKKSNNLQILASRLLIIGREDTLQMLAKLSEKDRAAKIDELVNTRVQQQKILDASYASVNLLSNTKPGTNGASSTGNAVSTFYFYNASSISQGYSDFKRVWGDRRLEDNWRRSKHTGGDLTAVVKLPNDADVASKFSTNKDNSVGNSYRQDLLKNIPLTPFQMDQSNTRVYNAYMDIGNFYRDILEDKKEAIAAYEILITRFPSDPNKPAIYYNLYRLYADIDKAKSDYYKNLLLNNYANSIYAKVILDPDYSKRMDDKDLEFKSFYNQVYDLYASRQYAEVIKRADALLKQYPDNQLSAQLAYLRAIAAGHQETLEPLKRELLQITASYPNDALIIPLVNQHLNFITAHNDSLAARPVVLVDNDLTDGPFAQQMLRDQQRIDQLKQIAAANAIRPKSTITTTKPANSTKPVTKPVTAPPLANNQPTVTVSPAIKPQTNIPGQPVVTPPKPVPSIFSMRDSLNYYFVVNVSTGTTNLASSRFGIGQFNRANFRGGTIKHDLKPVGDDNQLIFVGRFGDVNAVKDYARAIIPLMPQIMKVPADKYSFFIITKENLDKLADKKTLDSYIDYYQKNF